MKLKLNHSPSAHFKILGFFSLIILYLELLLRLTTKAVFFNAGLFYILISTVIIALLITFIAILLKPILRNIFLWIVLIIIITLFISQKVYFSVFNNYYTVYSATNASQVLQFRGVIFKAVLKNTIIIILMLLPLGLNYLLIKKTANLNINRKLIKSLLTLLMALSLFLGQLLLLGINKQSAKASYNNYYQPINEKKVVNNFGLITYMRLDSLSNILKTEVVLNPVVNKPAVIVEDEVAYNSINIDFDKLISQESDEVLINMHKYFRSITPSEKNMMTGKYKDYNVIQVTAESFSHLAVDKQLTPTLYELINEGIVFNNFYNPVWHVSTSDGEYAHMTGLIPKNGVWSMREVSNNYMPFVLGRQLSSLGYQTMAYHNHTYTYYDRDKTYPSFNYTYKGLGSGLEITKTWPESDLEMMELSINDYITSDLFHTYYMTVSGHMRYTFAGNYIASKNKDLVRHLDYNDNVKAYLATQIELDKALEYLIKQLEANNVLDNTLIVLVADHYPYGLEKSDLDNLAGHKVEETFELYKSGAIIYNSKMENLVVDKPVSSLDILATVSNMLGLEYDSRLLVGRDVFADKQALVIFNEGSFITEKGFYDASSQEFTAYNNIKVSNDYIQDKVNKVIEKFYYSSLILEKDYYKIVIK